MWLKSSINFFFKNSLITERETGDQRFEQPYASCAVSLTFLYIKYKTGYHTRSTYSKLLYFPNVRMLQVTCTTLGCKNKNNEITLIGHVCMVSALNTTVLHHDIYITVFSFYPPAVFSHDYTTVFM